MGGHLCYLARLNPIGGNYSEMIRELRVVVKLCQKREKLALKYLLYT